MCRQRLLAHRLAARWHPHVGLDDFDPSAERANVGSGSLQARPVTSGQHHVSSGARDRKRHLAPEAAAASGNEQPLAVQAKPIEHVHDQHSSAVHVEPLCRRIRLNPAHDRPPESSLIDSAKLESDLPRNGRKGSLLQVRDGAGCDPIAGDHGG